MESHSWPAEASVTGDLKWDEVAWGLSPSLETGSGLSSEESHSGCGREGKRDRREGGTPPKGRARGHQNMACGAERAQGLMPQDGDAQSVPGGFELGSVLMGSRWESYCCCLMPVSHVCVWRGSITHCFSSQGSGVKRSRPDSGHCMSPEIPCSELEAVLDGTRGVFSV